MVWTHRMHGLNVVLPEGETAHAVVKVMCGLGSHTKCRGWHLLVGTKHLGVWVG